MSARDEIRFAVDGASPACRGRSRGSSSVRDRSRGASSDVFSLDSALRPAKLAVLLRGRSRPARPSSSSAPGRRGRRSRSRSPTPAAHDRELGSGRPRCSASATSTSPARTCAGGSRFVEGAGGEDGPGDARRRGPALHRQLARARADARRGRGLAARPRARRARRVRRLRPSGLPRRRRGGRRAGSRRREARARRCYLFGRAPSAVVTSSRRSASTPPPRTSSTPRERLGVGAGAGARRSPSTRRRADEAGVADVGEVGEHRDRRGSRAAATHDRRRPPRREPRDAAAAAAARRAAASASSAGPWRSQPRAVERRPARCPAISIRRTRQDRRERAPRALPRARAAGAARRPLRRRARPAIAGPLTAAIIARSGAWRVLMRASRRNRPCSRMDRSST